jgi:integrase
MSITKITTRTQSVRYQVRYRDPHGHQIKRSFRTKREAEAFEDDERMRLRRGDWIDPNNGNVSFAEWANTWLASNPAKRESSFARDETIIRVHLSPMLGPLAIARISPLDIQRLVSEWSLKYKPRTVRRHYCTLASIFNTAVQCDLLARTPCRGIKLPKATKAAVKIIDNDDLPKLAKPLGDHGLMVYLAALLGLRWGEVAGLRVEDFNLLERTVSITHGIGRDRHGASVLGPLKTESSIRTIAMPSSLVEMVAMHLAGMGVNATDGEQLLFATGNGRPLSYGRWRSRKWVPACKAAGLDGLKFHDLRRSNATVMVASGIDIRTAQHRLGHADPRMTLAVYAQHSGQADQQAAVTLDNVFRLQA